MSGGQILPAGVGRNRGQAAGTSHPTGASGGMECDLLSRQNAGLAGDRGADGLDRFGTGGPDGGCE